MEFMHRTDIGVYLMHMQSSFRCFHSGKRVLRNRVWADRLRYACMSQFELHVDTHTHTHTNRSDIGTTFLNVQSNHNQPYGFRLIPQHIYLLDIVSSLHVYFFSKSGTRFNLLSKTTHQITFLSSSSSLDCKSVCACKCVECLWWC